LASLSSSIFLLKKEEVGPLSPTCGRMFIEYPKKEKTVLTSPPKKEIETSWMEVLRL
jgi:hypothetical protein